MVCKEHEEILLAAWREEQIHFEERERKKREQRLYGNWKLLIRGMQVKERIQRKYTSKIKVYIYILVLSEYLYCHFVNTKDQCDKCKNSKHYIITLAG